MLNIRQRSFMSQGLIVVVMVVGLFLPVKEGFAGMFELIKKHDVHLSPEVEGRVLKDGKPVEGLQISRSLTYEEELIDRTTTDVDGRFYFPSKTIQSRLPGRPLTDARNRQIVYATENGQHFILWHYTTDSIEPEITVTEKLSALNCDLSDPEKLYHFKWIEHPDFTHDVISICRWE